MVFRAVIEGDAGVDDELRRFVSTFVVQHVAVHGKGLGRLLKRGGRFLIYFAGRSRCVVSPMLSVFILDGRRFANTKSTSVDGPSSPRKGWLRQAILISVATEDHDYVEALRIHQGSAAWRPALTRSGVAVHFLSPRQR